MHYAALNPQVSLPVFKLLIDLGAFINYTTQDDQNVLMIYVSNAVDAETSIIKFLIHAGNNVNQISVQDGESTLHRAAYNPNSLLTTFELLISAGADVNHIDEDGWNVLSVYIEYANKINPAIIQSILRAGF